MAMKERIGFIGTGNLSQAIIKGWLAKDLIPSSDILGSNRTPGKLQKLGESLKIKTCSTNEDVVDGAEVVVLAVKPQDMETAIEPISSSFNADQVVISLAAGVTLRKLKRMLPQCRHIARVMANLPVSIRRGAFAYATMGTDLRVDSFMQRMFKPLGFTIKLEEGDAFEAFSVATSAGVGFIYELMIYWQEWLEERGLEPDIARQMTLHTFAGASELALSLQPLSLEELQSKVTSKKGITAAGLDSMRELEVERLLRYSFEKSAMRDRELAQE